MQSQVKNLVDSHACIDDDACMPILNYTTKVAPEKTVGEIVQILARKGASNISQSFEKGEVVGVSFVMPVGGVDVHFALPSNAVGVQAHMEKTCRGTLSMVRKKQIAEQAKRTAWRIVKDWIEAQIALVESRQADMGQVFMPYATREDGRTMYAHFVEHTQKQLGSGS